MGAGAWASPGLGPGLPLPGRRHPGRAGARGRGTGAERLPVGSRRDGDVSEPKAAAGGCERYSHASCMLRWRTSRLVMFTSVTHAHTHILSYTHSFTSITHTLGAGGPVLTSPLTPVAMGSAENRRALQTQHWPGF